MQDVPALCYDNQRTSHFNLPTVKLCSLSSTLSAYSRHGETSSQLPLVTARKLLFLPLMAFPIALCAKFFYQQHDFSCIMLWDFFRCLGLKSNENREKAKKLIRLKMSSSLATFIFIRRSQSFQNAVDKIKKQKTLKLFFACFARNKNYEF